MNRMTVAFILGLLLAASVSGQTVVVRVPAGRTVTATLQDVSSEVRVAPAPKIVALQFGYRDGGQFRAYAPEEPIVYDRPFLVRVRYDSEPAFAETSVTLASASGQRQITVAKTRADPAVFESRDIQFEDPTACKGLAFCTAIQGVFGDR
jgi:hypothetical protein